MNLHKVNNRNDDTLQQIYRNNNALIEIINEVNPSFDPRGKGNVEGSALLKAEPIGVIGELEKQSKNIQEATQFQSECLSALRNALFTHGSEEEDAHPGSGRISGGR